MFKLTPALLATALLLAPGLAPAQETAQESTGEAPATMAADAATVLAVVNGEEITLGHVIATRQSLPAQYQALPDSVLFEGILEQLIQQTVLSQAMGALSQRTEVMLENERRALIAGEKLDAVTAGAVTDEALQAAYDAAYANVEPETEYNASHILVASEEEARDLLDKLAGGADFAELAREFSTGPSGPNGGELGWFTQGMMVAPFEEAVMGLEVGQVAGPVQTQFGWHVLTLNDKRNKGAPAFEDVRDELVQSVENDAVEKALAALLEAADITRTDLTGIDAAAMRQDDLLQ